MIYFRIYFVQVNVFVQVFFCYIGLLGDGLIFLEMFQQVLCGFLVVELGVFDVVVGVLVVVGVDVQVGIVEGVLLVGFCWVCIELVVGDVEGGFWYGVVDYFGEGVVQVFDYVFFGYVDVLLVLLVGGVQYLGVEGGVVFWFVVIVGQLGDWIVVYEVVLYWGVEYFVEVQCYCLGWFYDYVCGGGCQFWYVGQQWCGLGSGDGDQDLVEWIVVLFFGVLQVLVLFVVEDFGDVVGEDYLQIGEQGVGDCIYLWDVDLVWLFVWGGVQLVVVVLVESGFLFVYLVFFVLVL